MARKKAKKSINSKSLLFIGISALGLILAIVGLFTPWLTSANGNVSQGIFAELFDKIQKTCTDLKIEIYGVGLVRTFSIISLVLSLIATTLIVLSALGVFRLEGLIKLIVSAGIVAVGVMLLIFAIGYINSLNAILGQTAYKLLIGVPYGFGDGLATMGIASFLLPVGTTISGVAYLLNK